MAKKYGFTRERDVRRALKTSRLVLDKRHVQGARFGTRPLTPPSTESIVNSAGACGCGTIYARGSVSTESYGEHATTYTITAPCDADWPFPEVTHDTGENWVSPEEDLCTCYGSSVPGQLTLTPCGSTTVCGVTRYHAKITLASTAGETRCDYETAEQPAAVWYIDDWHPLGPTSEAVLVSSTVVPNSLECWTPPGKLCVGPKVGTVTVPFCEGIGDVVWPETINIIVTDSGCWAGGIEVALNLTYPSFLAVVNEACSSSLTGVQQAGVNCTPSPLSGPIGATWEGWASCASGTGKVHYSMTVCGQQVHLLETLFNCAVTNPPDMIYQWSGFLSTGRPGNPEDYMTEWSDTMDCTTSSTTRTVEFVHKV